jgi:hypothetical protein
MNWRRGLLRLWIVFAAAWIVAVASCWVVLWYNDPWRVVSVDYRPPPLSDALASPSSPPPWVFAAAAVAGPLVTLGSGVGLIWAIRGFRLRR